jgi:hypothetical protein
MSGKLRAIAPVQEKKHYRITRAPIAPPPRVAWVSVKALVIDESYQRHISAAGARLVRQLIQYWDWNRYKALSVAPTGDGKFEIVDGQHTAIAAISHGGIEMLPCLILDSASAKERAADFVGINTTRTNLTPYALFRAQLVALDPLALEAQAALDEVGANMIESVRAHQTEYAAGTLACPSAVLFIARKGGRAGLVRSLRACMAADLRPIPSTVLRMVHYACARSTDAELLAIARQCA